MTRREFVNAAVLMLPVAHLLYAKRPYGSFNMGLQSFVLRNVPFEKALDMVQEVGLAYLETYNDHLSYESPARYLAHIKRALRAHRIRLMAFGVIGFDTDTKRSRAIFEFAKTMGLYAISADPDPGAFETLEALVEEFSINIAIHPHGPEYDRYPGWKAVGKAINSRHPRMGICMDVGHVTRAGEDAVEGIYALGKRVCGVHLKDADAQHHDVIAGRGQIDIPGIFKALKQVGYRGMVSLECEMTPNNPMGDIRESLAYIQRVCAKF